MHHIPVEAALFCGQEHIQALPNDLPREVSFVSSGNSLVFIYSVHEHYSELMVSLTISVTRCKGYYLHNILSEIKVPLDSIVIPIDSDECLQLHSSFSYERRYSNIANRLRADEKENILFRCRNISCSIQNVGFNIEYLQSKDQHESNKHSRSGLFKKTVSKHAFGLGYKYHYIQHIGRHAVGISVRHFISIKSFEFICIVFVEQTPCQISCNSITEVAYVATGLCDICRTAYVDTNISPFQVRVNPNTCFRIFPLSSDMNISYSILYRWWDPNIGTPFQWIWPGISGMFQINSGPDWSVTEIQVMEHIENKHSSKQAYLLAYFEEYDTELNSLSKPPSVVSHSQPMSKMPNIQLKWKWKQYTLTVHRLDRTVSWSFAEKRCNEIGGHLMSLHSNEDLNSLRRKLYFVTVPRRLPFMKFKYEFLHQHLYHIGLMIKVSIDYTVTSLSCILL